MAETTLQDAFVKNFGTLSSDINSHEASSWLKKRKEAINTFAKQGFPHAKSEEYKYTNLGKALGKVFSAEDVSKPTADVHTENQLLDMEANVLVFVNGMYQPSSSSIIEKDDKIIITELSEAYEEYAQLVDENLAVQAKPESDPYIALNTAYGSHGVLVHVPKSKVVEHPIVIYYLTTTDDTKVISQPRNLVLVDENAQVKLVEMHRGTSGQPSYTNDLTEITVAENARVELYKVEETTGEVYQTSTTQVLQRKNSFFAMTTVSLDGEMIRNNLNVDLEDEHIETHMFGLSMLKNQAHVDHHTTVDHKKPNCYSNEIYKGVFDEKSKGVFNGKIYVRKHAQKTNAYQSNANVLLSDKATIDTKPQLEIWADDVKCSHGATIGQLDEEQLFYLRSRGIEKNSARAMLLNAFARDVLENVSIEPLKTYLEERIASRFNQK